VYTSVYLEGRLTLFIKFHLLIKKNRAYWFPVAA